MNLLSLCRKTQPRKTISRFLFGLFCIAWFWAKSSAYAVLKMYCIFRTRTNSSSLLENEWTRFDQTLHMSKQMICASIELITHPLIFCIKYKQKVLSILDKTAQLADTSSFQNEINTRENHINYSSAHLCCKIVSYFHQSFPMWVRY